MNSPEFSLAVRPATYRDWQIDFDEIAPGFEAAKQAGYIAVETKPWWLERDWFALSPDGNDVRMWARGLSSLDLSDPEAGAGFELRTVYAEGLTYQEHTVNQAVFI